MSKKKEKDTVTETPQETPPAVVLTVSRETLDATPGRILTLLLAIGTVPAIRAAMATKGYTDEDHAEGWSLLHVTAGFSNTAAPLGIQVDAGVRDALVALDTLDEDLFRVVRAALTRLHPAQGEFVLAGGLGASTGAAAVVGVHTLLDRLDELGRSADRKATHKEDAAALATLAKRGVDAKKRAELRALVAKAESATDAPAGDPNQAQTEAQHLQALVAARAWFEDWSETAKSVIKRRDYLIKMGFAKRKSAAKPAPVPVPVPSSPGAAAIVATSARSDAKKTS